MTLLESMIAFVLLAVVGVACLDLTRGATALETRGAEWTRAVATGESVIAAVAAGVPQDELARDGVKIARRRWAGDAGVESIEVAVALPDGAEFRVSRLLRVSNVSIPGNAR